MLTRFAVYAVAAASGILGAGSLLLFCLFLWTGAPGIVAMRMADSTALLWDAGLCLLFFLQHSGMVRKSFRAQLSRVVPANAHGIVYTIASGIALILLVVCWQGPAVRLYAVGGAARYLVRGILLLSLAGFVWGIRSLGAFDAFGIDAYLSHIRGRRPEPPSLSIAGPYRLVRHPFYAFAIAALWAMPVLSADRLVLNTLFTAWIAFGATLEERDMVAQFGEEYKRYQLAVPMFVPLRWARPGRVGRGRSSAAGGFR